MIGGPYIARCFSDHEESANICIDIDNATNLGIFTIRPSSIVDPYVTLNQVFDHIAESARMEPAPAADR